MCSENNKGKKKKCVGVCVGGSCYNAGSEGVMEHLEGHYKVKAGEGNDSIDLDYVGCLGHCDFGVNIEVDGEVMTSVNKDNVIAAIEEGKDPGAGNLQPKENLDDILSNELENL